MPIIRAAPTHRAQSDADQMDLVADWNDINAAAEIAADQAEAVVVRTSESGGTGGGAEAAADGSARALSHTVWFQTSTDQRGWLLFTSNAPLENGGESCAINVQCQLSGDPPRRRLMLERLAIRLADLRGVDFAPIRP